MCWRFRKSTSFDSKMLRWGGIGRVNATSPKTRSRSVYRDNDVIGVLGSASMATMLKVETDRTRIVRMRSVSCVSRSFVTIQTDLPIARFSRFERIADGACRVENVSTFARQTRWSCCCQSIRSSRGLVFSAGIGRAHDVFLFEKTGKDQMKL